MKPCQQNTTMPAYTALEGQFDFNKTPLATPVIKLIVHEKPQQRKTWWVHGVPGWYIVLAMEHYLFYTCYTPNTREERHSDAVDCFPQHLIMPGLPATEQATRAAEELMNEINNPGPQTPVTIGESQLQASINWHNYVTPCN